MISKEQRDIQIASSEKGSNAAILYLDRFDSAERIKRALTMLGLLWLLAAISVFIPIAHWGLVPGFFIAGPIAAFSRYKMTEALEKVNGPCPSCEADITISLEAGDQLPKWTYCPNCNHSVQLVSQQEQQGK